VDSLFSFFFLMTNDFINNNRLYYFFCFFRKIFLLYTLLYWWGTKIEFFFFLLFVKARGQSEVWLTCSLIHYSSDFYHVTTNHSKSCPVINFSPWSGSHHSSGSHVPSSSPNFSELHSHYITKNHCKYCSSSAKKLNII